MKVIAALYSIFLITMFAGWVSNIIQLCGANTETWTTTMTVKVVGIIAGPLGSVMGIIGWF